MIITISRERLLTEINKISRIISHKSPIVALTGLLFEVKPDKLILTGTDGILSMRVEIKKNESNLQIEEMGKVLIKVRFVSEVMRKIESDIVRIEVVEGNIIRINAHNFDTQLNTLNFNDYPKIIFDNYGKEFILKGAMIKSIISQIGFAVNDKPTNPLYSGVHFLFTNGKLKIAATDLFRLATKEMNFSYFEAEDYQVIIPIRVLQEVAKVCFEQKEVGLIINERNVIFKVDSMILQSKIVEGKILDISKVIPKTFASTIAIKNRDLTNAIDRASVLGNETSNTTIKMVVDASKIQVECSSSEIGTSNEQLKDFQFHGNDTVFSFRSSYMLDAIRSFKTENININLSQNNMAIVITSEEAPGLLQLVLPVMTY